MISSERKYNKFSKTLSPKLAAWLADDHTYISDKKNQLTARAKRQQNASADWDLHLVTFNKMFIEWAVENSVSDELGEKISFAVSDSQFEPITKDYRVEWRLKKEFPEVDWATKTNQYLDISYNMEDYV